MTLWALPGLAAAVPAEVAPGVPVIRAVDDGVLAQMRGRGIGGDTITGFRLEMVSTWSAAGGQLSASSTLQVEGLQGVHPSLQGGSSAQWAGNLSAPGDGLNGGASGNLEVHGVGQLTQVAGDANQAHNSFVMRLVPDSTPLPPVGSSQVFSQLGGQGVSAGFAPDGNGGVELTLATPQGNARQHIGADGGGGFIRQLIQVQGNAQQVNNAAVLTILTHAGAAGPAGAALLGQLRNMMPQH